MGWIEDRRATAENRRCRVNRNRAWPNRRSGAPSSPPTARRRTTGSTGHSARPPRPLPPPPQPPRALVPGGRDLQADRRGVEEGRGRGDDRTSASTASSASSRTATGPPSWSAPTSTPCRSIEADRPPLREQGHDHRRRGQDGRRDARLRPRRPHDVPRRHGPVARRAQGPLVGHRRPRSASPPRRRSAGPRRCSTTASTRGSPSPITPSPCTSPTTCRRARSPTPAGPAMASSTSVDVIVRGKGGHGALPHNTIDPIVLAALLVLDLQTIVSREINPIDPAVVTVGSIHGGTKHNIIPNEVRLQLTLRAYKPEVRRPADRGDRPQGEGPRRSPTGARARRSSSATTRPPTINTPSLVDRVVPVLKKAVGESNVAGGRADDGRRGLRPVLDRAACRSSCSAWARSRPTASRARGRRASLPPLHSSLFKPDAAAEHRDGDQGDDGGGCRPLTEIEKRKLSFRRSAAE